MTGINNSNSYSVMNKLNRNNKGKIANTFDTYRGRNVRCKSTFEE